MAVRSRFGTQWRSIDRELPLLISGLLLATVTAFTTTAYVRTKRILVNAAVDRLRKDGESVGNLLAQSMANNMRQLAAIAADSSVVRYLQSGRESPRIFQVLATQLPSAATGRGRVDLRRADGAIALDSTRGTPPPDAGWIQQTIATHPTKPTFAPFFAEHDSVYETFLAPVTSGGQTIGYVSGATYLAASSAAMIRDLIGPNVSMIIGSPTEGVWTDLDRIHESPPRGFPVGERYEYDGRKGAVVGTSKAISGTPWVLWIEQPRTTVLAPAQNLLMEMATLAALFILAGIICGIALSRRITRPIVALTQAAERVAADETATAAIVPVAEDRDEVTRMTEAFVRMQTRVKQFRQDLEEQVDEAQALAEELEATNDELRLALNAADEARDDAEVANRVKSDFLAVMSHELRTPLNAIIGYAELLRAGLSGPLTDDAHDKLSRMRRSADQLLRLVNQLLNIERIDAGREELLAEPIDIEDLIRAAAADVEMQAAERGLQLRLETPDHAITIVTDVAKLRQILLNLLSNAVKYTEHGEIRVRARSSDGKLVLMVEDTGIGIRPEHRARIFEPFWQVDQRLTRRVGGTGLGLTIVQRLIHLMGGEISVDSTLGKGSTFTVQLPLAQSHAA